MPQNRSNSTGRVVGCIAAGRSNCNGDAMAKGGEVKCKTCGKMNCMAHGGESKEEPMELDMDMDAAPKDDMAGVDDELLDMAAEELVHAIEKKDTKGIVEAIKALVMSCKE